MECHFDLQSQKELQHTRKQLALAEKDTLDIDRIIQKLYEDHLNGKLSEECFRTMSLNYEAEQAELKNASKALQKDISQKVEGESRIERFMMMTQKYTHLEHLLVEVVNELVDKIIISYSDSTKFSRKKKIEIYYNFIGRLKNE